MIWMGFRLMIPVAVLLKESDRVLGRSLETDQG